MIKRLVSVLFSCLFSVLTFGAAVACTANEIDVLGDGTDCQTSKFELTTTSLAANSMFSFRMSAEGTFYVDCGAGGTLSQSSLSTGSTLSGKTITRTSLSSGLYNCLWSSSGVHTIKIGGLATGYNNASSAILISSNGIRDYSTISFALDGTQYSAGVQNKIASVSGSLGAIFPWLGSNENQYPSFANTFENAVNLTSVSPTLFSGLTGGAYMFYSTFSGCTGLTTIPDELFSDVDTSSVTNTTAMFNGTFAGTGITSVPAGLFSDIDTSSATNTTSMFQRTFSGTGLTSIPAELFSNIDTSSVTSTSEMFRSTFSGCAGLTTVPTGLFGDIDMSSVTNASGMFQDTFKGCTGLTTVPAELFGAIDTSSVTNTNAMFDSTFSDCTGLTTVPAGLFSAIDTSSATDTGGMFRRSFLNCTSLANIPSGLFSAIDTSSAINTVAMFFNTFSGCTNMTGYIPPTTFPSTIVPGSSNSTNMWYQTFNGTNLATSCPVGTAQYITGFESEWGYSNGNTSTNGTNRVSCQTCSGSLPAHATYTNGCTWSCDTGYVENNGACETACQTGYYGSGSNCTACSNGPSHSTYSGTATTNSCPWTCDAGYYADNGACVACAAGTYNATAGATSVSACLTCATGQYSASGASECIACSNAPAGATYTGSAQSNACPFDCPNGSYVDGNSCTACVGAPQHATYNTNTSVCTWSCDSGYIEDNGTCVEDTSSCDTFTVTTTNMAANTTFSFYLSAAGVFQVDWGDGSAITTIDRTNNTDSAELYSHTYATAGTYTIGFCGTPTAYRVPGSADKPPITDTTISFNTTSKAKIASIGGSLGALFPTLNNGATNEDQPRFYKTFQECTNITSIPAGLFTGVTGSAQNMYRETFDRCSGITTIPSNLFVNATGGAKNMFRSVFNLCTSLTAIPENLFSGITGAYENQFKYVFYGDNSMTGYIPPSTFSGLIANGSPTATNMWQEAFTGGNTLATSCNGFEGMTQFITGYEGNTNTTWNNKVSCAPATCSAGKILINGVCGDPAFTVTTTSNTTELSFALAAKGVFYVDCGDGGVLSGGSNSNVDGTKITRSGVSSAYYTCTWESAGAHTILFGGGATEYGTDASISFYKRSNGTQNKIATVTGSLSSVFPQLGTGSGQSPLFIDTFRDATNLTSIPAGLFSGVTDGVQNMFNGTFYGCTSLASIPSGLFSDLDTGATNTFANTFNGCTTITSIPANMFGDISTGAESLFYGTFGGCTNITAIPADLFSNITTAADFMFSDTFNGATNLSGYIPPTTFAGLIANDSPTATNMWQGTFTGTNVATSCDSFTDMRQYITNYESYWNGKVSCEDLPNKCKNATYYDENNPNADANGCVACPTGYNYNTDAAKDSVDQCQIHCVAGTYVATIGGTCVAVDDGYYANETILSYGEVSSQTALQVCTGATYRNENNQCVACPTGYNYNTENGKTSINQCQIHCNAGHYLASAGDSSCSEVGDGYYAAAETLNYGSVSVHVQCPNPGERTGTTTAESVAECSILCTGATYFDHRTDRCVACPTGYTAHVMSGKTSASECQIACAAGTYLAAAGDVNCIPVGVGYWATASMVNYGSTGSRTACASGQTTNSNTAGSASECLVTCTGATYRDANNQCAPCPTGYNDNIDTGKTSPSQCQHMCAAGTYMTLYTPVEYIQGDGTSTFLDTGYEVTTTNIKIRAVVGTATTTTGDVGNFFGNIYTTVISEDPLETETGGFSSNYKSNVFGLWLRKTNTNGDKAKSPSMQFTANTPYTIDYTITASGTTATGTMRVNGGTAASKSQNPVILNGSGNRFKLFTNGAAYIDENDTVIGNRWGDKISNARIYSLKLWDGGTTDAYLKLDLVPVRRNSDNVLGFYNRVNDEFYPNVGKGSFSSATCTVDSGDAADACDVIAACSPVGYGYYAGQSYNNYGSSGVRHQCPNGAGTIVNGEPINNAGSIYNCEGIDPCTGANYPDYETGICTPCPAGYTADVTDNKESISQCKIHCNDGYYVYEEFDSQCTAAEDGYYIAAADVKYGIATEPSMCTNAPGHSTYTDSAATDNCPWVCDAKYYAVDGACVDAGVGYYSADGENIRHECTNTKPEHSSYVASATSNDCPYACDAGYYAVGNECVDAGAGYYSPAADDARYACTNTKPANSSYSDSATTNNCPWECDIGYMEENGACIEVITSCEGATYLDNNECVACPTGYDANTTAGKTSASQCQISCAAGTYLANENDTSCTSVGVGYYSAATTVHYGSTSSRTACTNAKPVNSSYTGSATVNACPYACDATYYLDNGACVDAGVGYYSAAGENERHQCDNIKPENSSYSGSAATNNCPWSCDGGYAESGGECVTASCTGATYMDNGSCVSCPTGYDYNTTDGKTAITDCQINCGVGTYLATANDTACTNVGAGYWAVGGVVNYGSTSTRNQCALGLTTIGYGHGADEAADCGLVLNVGSDVFYARSARKTTPSLNFKTSTDEIFYVNLGTENNTISHLHFGDGTNVWTAYDDSLFYEERIIAPLVVDE